MSRPIIVQVRSVAGEVLVQIRAETCSGGLSLKRQIRKQLQFHPICQTLVVGGKVLGDSDTLDSVGIEHSYHQLCLTLVVSYEFAFSQLASTLACDRVEAVEALAEAGTPGDEHIIEALLKCLKHDHGSVRSAAARALGKVAPRGMAHVVAEFRRCLNTGHQDLPDAAVEALSSLATHGDVDTASALTSAWNLLSPRAATLLIELCPKGHDMIIRDLQAFCSKGDERRRHMAIFALGGLALPGDLTSTAVLLKCTRDTIAAIRVEAVRSLGQVAPQSHREAISAMLYSLQDWNSELKKEALKGLRQLAPKGDQQVITVFCKAIETDFQELRNLAIAGLVEIAPPGHVKAKAALNGVEDLDDRTAIDWLACS